MRRTSDLAVSANNICLCVACVLGVLVGLSLASAQTPDLNSKQIRIRSLSQAVIAYSFLRWDYLDLDKLFASDASLQVVQNLQALDSALKSLDCDVPMRLAVPHKALILPPLPFNHWVGFRRTGGRNSPEGGWLFVTQPSGNSPQRVLVVFSSSSPEETTVFSIEEADKGYLAELLFDSFKKGKISNASTMMGAVTSIRLESNTEMLVKDWGEPGVGPPNAMRVGRVFRLDLSRDTVALVSPGAPEHR